MSVERMFAPTPSQYPQVLRHCHVEKALAHRSLRYPFQHALKHHSESDLCRVAKKDSKRAPSPVTKKAASETGRKSWSLAPNSNARRAEGSAEAKASVQLSEEAAFSV